MVLLPHFRRPSLTLVLTLLTLFCVNLSTAYAGTYTFSGQILFPIGDNFTEIWDTNGDGYAPLPFAEVSVYDKDLIGSNLLATTQTNADGQYSVTFSYSGPALDPNPDAILAVTLHNSWQHVEQWGGFVYTFKSSTMSDLSPGHYDTTLTLNDSENDSIAATIHAILSWGMDYFYNVEGAAFHSDVASVFPGGWASSYSFLGDNFFKKVDSNNGNELSLFIVLHEHAHSLAERHPDFTNNTSGYDGSHDFESSEVTNVAFYEGWADFLAMYLTEKLMTDPYRRLTERDQTYAYSISSEALEYRPYNAMNDTNESNVAAAFWDLNDTETDSQTYFLSSTQDYPVKNVVPWSNVTNVTEVYRVFDINSTHILMMAKLTSGDTDLVVATRGTSPRTAARVARACASLTSSEAYLTPTKIYEVCSPSVYRHPLSSPSTTEKILGTYSALITYPGDVDQNHVRIMRSSDRNSLMYWTFPESGSGFAPVAYRIDQLDFLAPKQTRLGSAPTGCDAASPAFVANDKIYCFLGNLPNDDAFIEHDPATSTTTELWPLNSTTDKISTSHTGPFNDVLGFDLNMSLHPLLAVGSRAYFFKDNRVYEIDLTNGILARHAGNGTIGSVNAANLMSSFEDNSELVSDGNRHYYVYVSDAGYTLPIANLRRVELDPVNERVTAYCGNDTIDLDLADIFDNLNSLRPDIVSYDTELMRLFGGDHASLLDNNWINPNRCETTVPETVATANTSSTTMTETAPWGDDSGNGKYHDGTDERVVAPATVVATGTDTDGDGIPDFADTFPNDASETADFDNDGTGDNADTDDDNDGTPDASDAFPYDEREDTDSDGDGIGDNYDTTP